MLIRLLTIAMAATVFTVTIGCSKTRACKDGTLFVSYDLGNAASSAETLEVAIAVDGGAPKVSMVERKSHASKSSLEVDFPTGYPVGMRVDIAITALSAGSPVWSATGSLVLPASCGNVTLQESAPEDLGAASTDLGNPSLDAGAGDMQQQSVVDMIGEAPTPDMAAACGTVSMPCCVTGNACVQGAACQNSACAESDIWVLGADYSDLSNIKTVLAHYDGTSWAIDNSISQVNAGVSVAWGDGPADYFIGGSNGNAYWYNGQWNQCVGGGTCPPTNSSTSFQAIHGIASNDIWFAGSNDVLHYNGFNFVRTVNGLPASYYMSAICGRATNDIWGVSLGGSYHWDGTQWTAFSNVKAAGCWAAAPNDVWAAGNSIQHWDGSAWSAPYQVNGGAVPGTIQKVDGTATDDVWGVGSDTNSNAVIVHWNGTSWSRIQGGGSTNLNWIWAVSKTDAWIPTTNGMLRWNGTAWAAYTGLPVVANVTWGLIWGSATGGQ